MVVETEVVLITVVLVTADGGVMFGEGGVAIDEVLEVVRVKIVAIEAVGVADKGVGLVVAEVVDESAVDVLDEEDVKDEDEVAIGASLEILNGAPLSG